MLASAVRSCVAVVLTNAAVAQCPPGAPMPLDVAIETAAPGEGPARLRWDAGRSALAKDDFAAARGHLQAALEFHPSSAPILFDLMLASRDDADLLAMAVDRFVRASANAQGRVTLDATQKKAVAAVPGLEAQIELAKTLVQARAAAIADLARFVERNKPSGPRNAAKALLVRWAADGILTAGRGAPGVVGGVALAVDTAQGAFAADHDVVLQALARLMRQKPAPAAKGAPGTGPAVDPAAVQDRALRAARIVTGLDAQSHFKDLKGPPPVDVGKLADEAQRLLDTHFAAFGKGRVWTVTELEKLTPAEAAAFTLTHTSWRDPGVATSPNGRYRIETTCGHGTLLDAARSVEKHHARLVSHYGVDPFEQRQGIVRIVPEHGDLEAAGVPYWWAGGFQAGDVTTIRFAWSNVAALGRTLTHELTHRFDGTLRPFLGGWYGEGHAEWTGKNYQKIDDAAFFENTLEVFTVAMACYKGYGGDEKFGQLLTGTIADYRDNYVAGYSLYSFLRSFPPGAPRYRDALPAFERNARAGQKDPIAYFTKTFCDGKQGRPAAFADLVTDWNTFLRGCYDWNQDKRKGNEWVAKYRGSAGHEAKPLELDPPTWSWARHRAEPWFGQDHAAAATLLLHEAGDFDGAVAAGVWSLVVDGWRLETSRALLSALVATKANDAAAAFASLARRRFTTLDAPPSTPTACPKAVTALIDALTARVATLDAAGTPAAAAACTAERDDLARLCGLPPLPTRERRSIPTPARHVGDHGFTESDLTDYQERRQKGLWYATAEGDLHVGRERPRDGTGTLDREAHDLDAFVHTVAWQRPGRYVLRGRVHFTTSFVEGCIVFGHQRADRDLRLHFSAGDRSYAIGKSETRQNDDVLALRLTGLWERDGRMPGTRVERALDLAKDHTWFDYEVRIDGPRVTVLIDGEESIDYAMHDGAPIEGNFGFAMSAGAIRVQQPTVQRLDDGTGSVRGLDLARQPSGTLDDLLRLPVSGVPAGPNGTFVVWVPKQADENASPIASLSRAMPIVDAIRGAAHDYPQNWVVAVPRTISAADRSTASRTVQAKDGPPPPFVDHDVGAPFTGAYPWILFVDGLGLLRAASPIDDPGIETRVKRWSRMFRGR